MAEREGFEPSRRFPAYTLSRRAPSTTRPTVHRALSIQPWQDQQGGLLRGMNVNRLLIVSARRSRWNMLHLLLVDDGGWDAWHRRGEQFAVELCRSGGADRPRSSGRPHSSLGNQTPVEARRTLELLDGNAPGALVQSETDHYQTQGLSL